MVINAENADVPHRPMCHVLIHIRVQLVLVLNSLLWSDSAEAAEAEADCVRCLWELLSQTGLPELYD